MYCTFRHDLVLFSGRKKIRDIATSYGFQHYLTVSDLHASHPSSYPDVPPEHGVVHRPLHAHDRIAAVCVLMDPFNWEKELQVGVKMHVYVYVHVCVNPVSWRTYHSNCAVRVHAVGACRPARFVWLASVRALKFEPTQLNPERPPPPLIPFIHRFSSTSYNLMGVYTATATSRS
jgi:hypothetical protein